MKVENGVMSKKILELSTKKSLYKPIVIRVDGKEYGSAMITAELFEKTAADACFLQELRLRSTACDAAARAAARANGHDIL